MNTLFKFLLKNVKNCTKIDYKNLILLRTHASNHGSMKVTVVGAAGKIGQLLCLMLKQSPLIDELCIHDVKPTSALGLELNHIDTKCKVTAYSGKDNLQIALQNSKIVTIIAAAPGIDCAPLEKMWKPNSVIMKEVMGEVARNCPKALIAIGTNPINSIVPMASEILKKGGSYNANGVFGITSLNTVRANTFVAQVQGLEPESVTVPIIGGHSPETIIPVLSQAKPCGDFTNAEIEDITASIRHAQENITNLKPEESGPLSSAFATARFIISLVKAVQGYPDIVECAFVTSKVHPFVKYLATPLILGPNGLAKNLGLPPLSDFEQCMFDNAIPLLANDITKGEKSVGIHDPPPPCDPCAAPPRLAPCPHSLRMDCDEFRSRGKDMIEYICNYLQKIETRRVTPNIEPGYLRKLIPGDAPLEPEDWDSIMADVESKIMPGVTHWQHPRFHAYFPSGNSFPSILGDMLSDAIGCIGFSWAACPALTELETIVLDWLGKAIGLPDQFLAFTEGSRGGGVIQSSASECVLVSMLAARAQALKRLKQQHPFVEEGVLLSKLMAYCSKEAHSCVEKAAMISFVKLRILEPDEKSSLRGKTLMMAMEEDETMGLIPFFVSTTLGTTSCCSFDNLPEIGVVCQKFPCIWLHVDAAYAGNALICPELKYLLNGIEYADSFNANSNKWLLTNFDCSTMWVRDRIRFTSGLIVDPLYLQHGYSDATIDYRHWGVPLSRRFRSLKLWFVLRSYGIAGLQKYVRLHIRLAKRFEGHVLKDGRFEICNEVKLGLVCFRLKGVDKLNEKLLSNINASGKLHMVPASVNEKYVIRFCVVSEVATDADIDHAWEVICEFADDLLEMQNGDKEQG